MFSVTVRDHMMIAHSLRGEVFGPRSGCTARPTSSTRRSGGRTLDADGIVVDIGRATEELRAVLGELSYRNLDDEPALRRHEHHHRGAGPGGRRPAGRADARRRARRRRARVWPASRSPCTSPTSRGRATSGRCDADRCTSSCRTGIDDPARPSGGNVYDRRLCDGLLPRAGVDEHAVPDPGRADARRRLSWPRCLGRLPDGAVVLVDGLIASVGPGACWRRRPRRLRLVVLVHMPFGDATLGPGAREAAVLVAAAARWSTTSEWTRRSAARARTRCAAERVHVAEPGVDPADRGRGTAPAASCSASPRSRRDKGHDVLLAALAELADLPWH